MPSTGNVLIVVENLPVPFDRRVWSEATSLHQEGYGVTVIAPQGPGATEPEVVIDGIRVLRHPCPPEGSGLVSFLREYAHALLWEWRLARKAWRRQPFDIVHICNPPDLLFLITAWFKWWHGVPVIYDQHDLCPEIWEAKFGRRGLVVWLLKALERLSYRTADAVLAPNYSYARTALRRGRKDPRSVFVVRSGPRLKDFFPAPPYPGFRRGRAHLVGYVGVMGKQEGLDLLLQSIRHIVWQRQRRDVHFVLIGDGPERPALQRLASRWGIAPFVEFTGRVPDLELRTRLSSCDLCVNPDPKTRFNDQSTMNKILEYMALGKSIVQYDLVEGRYSAGPASLYANPDDPVDFAEQVLWLLAHPVQARHMGMAGYRRMADALEWTFQVPHLLAAYRFALHPREEALMGWEPSRAP